MASPTPSSASGRLPPPHRVARRVVAQLHQSLEVLERLELRTLTRPGVQHRARLFEGAGELTNGAYQVGAAAVLVIFDDGLDQCFESSGFLLHRRDGIATANPR